MTQPAPEVLFDLPGSTTNIKWEDHRGQLVLIWPKIVKPHTFRNGDTGEITEARVVVLDPPGGTPVEYAQVGISSKLLQAAIRHTLGTGRPNLGRISQGQATHGNSPPWILTDPNEADKQLAVRFLQNQSVAVPADGGVAAGAAAPAAQPSWGQRAPQATPQSNQPPF